MPAVSDLKILFAGMNPWKAISESRIGPDLFAAAPGVLADLYHPLYVKAALSCDSSATWKLGQSMHLENVAGASRVTQFRDIRLEDPPSKVWGAWERKWLIEPVNNMTCESQWGSGLHGGSTEITYLAIESGMKAICAKGTSAAVIYADIVAAFAEANKCLISEDDVSKAELLAAAVGAGIDAGFATEVIKDMTDAGCWSAAGASPHLEALVRDNIPKPSSVL